MASAAATHMDQLFPVGKVMAAVLTTAIMQKIIQRIHGLLRVAIAALVDRQVAMAARLPIPNRSNRPSDPTRRTSSNHLHIVVVAHHKSVDTNGLQTMLKNHSSRRLIVVAMAVVARTATVDSPLTIKTISLVVDTTTIAIGITSSILTTMAIALQINRIPKPTCSTAAGEVLINQSIMFKTTTAATIMLLGELHQLSSTLQILGKLQLTPLQLLPIHGQLLQNKLDSRSLQNRFPRFPLTPIWSKVYHLGTVPQIMASNQPLVNLMALVVALVTVGSMALAPSVALAVEASVALATS